MDGETLSSGISWMDGWMEGETPSSLWLSLPLCVNEWSHMVIFGHVWSAMPIMVMCSPVKSCVVIYGHGWSYMVF